MFFVHVIIFPFKMWISQIPCGAVQYCRSYYVQTTSFRICYNSALENWECPSQRSERALYRCLLMGEVMMSLTSF